MSFPDFRLPLTFCTMLVCAFALAAAPTTVRADDKDMPRTVSVSGSGSAKARPDTAHITTGVVSDGATARAALKENTTKMTKIIEEMKGLGIPAKDLQTVNFAVHPKYTRPKEGEAPQISGYRVVNTIRVTVADIEQLGPILDTMVAEGSNEIGGISFSIAEADELTDEARKNAMDDAKRKAELLAQAAGAKLGKVMTIAEDVVRPLPRQTFARAAVAAESAPPIEAGEEKLTVRVSVTWALD